MKPWYRKDRSAFFFEEVFPLAPASNSDVDEAALQSILTDESSDLGYMLAYNFLYRLACVQLAREAAGFSVVWHAGGSVVATALKVAKRRDLTFRISTSLSCGMIEKQLVLDKAAPRPVTMTFALGPHLSSGLHSGETKKVIFGLNTARALFSSIGSAPERRGEALHREMALIAAEEQAFVLSQRQSFVKLGFSDAEIATLLSALPSLFHHDATLFLGVSVIFCELPREVRDCDFVFFFLFFSLISRKCFGPSLRASPRQQCWTVSLL